MLPVHHQSIADGLEFFPQSRITVSPQTLIWQDDPTKPKLQPLSFCLPDTQPGDIHVQWPCIGRGIKGHLLLEVRKHLVYTDLNGKIGHLGIFWLSWIKVEISKIDFLLQSTCVVLLFTFLMVRIISSEYHCL